MPFRKRIAIALACLHLFCVATFIWTNTLVRLPGAAQPVVRLYQNLSGLFRDYTFFAPNVASDVKAGFLVEDAAGHTTLVNFLAPEQEVGFHYNCIVSACLRDEPARDLFARSWAALLLGSDPGARKVTVFAKALLQPTMAEYRHGHRPQWQLIYASQFGRVAGGLLAASKKDR